MLREYSQLPGCAKTEKATSSARLCLLASLGLGIVGLPRHGAVNPRIREEQGWGCLPVLRELPQRLLRGRGGAELSAHAGSWGAGPAPCGGRGAAGTAGPGLPGGSPEAAGVGPGDPPAAGSPPRGGTGGPRNAELVVGREQGEVTGPSSVPASPLGGGRGVCNARGCLSLSLWVWESRACSGAGLGSSAEVLDVSEMRLLSSQGICWCFP